MEYALNALGENENDPESDRDDNAVEKSGRALAVENLAEEESQGKPPTRKQGDFIGKKKIRINKDGEATVKVGDWEIVVEGNCPLENLASGWSGKLPIKLRYENGRARQAWFISPSEAQEEKKRKKQLRTEAHLPSTPLKMAAEKLRKEIMATIEVVTPVRDPDLGWLVESRAIRNLPKDYIGGKIVVKKKPGEKNSKFITLEFVRMAELPKPLEGGGTRNVNPRPDKRGAVESMEGVPVEVRKKYKDMLWNEFLNTITAHAPELSEPIQNFINTHAAYLVVEASEGVDTDRAKEFDAAVTRARDNITTTAERIGVGNPSQEAIDRIYFEGYRMAITQLLGELRASYIASLDGKSDAPQKMNGARKALELGRQKFLRRFESEKKNTPRVEEWERNTRKEVWEARENDLLAKFEQALKAGPTLLEDPTKTGNFRAMRTDVVNAVFNAARWFYIYNQKKDPKSDRERAESLVAEVISRVRTEKTPSKPEVPARKTSTEAVGKPKEEQNITVTLRQALVIPFKGQWRENWDEGDQIFGQAPHGFPKNGGATIIKTITARSPDGTETLTHYFATEEEIATGKPAPEQTPTPAVNVIAEPLAPGALSAGETNAVTQELKGPAIEHITSYENFGAQSVANPVHPKRNEDKFFADPKLGMFGVFDGMSNPPGGEVAADVARQFIKNALARIPLESTPTEVRTVLGNIFADANTRILEIAKKKNLGNIGTTATIVKLLRTSEKKTVALIASIGDSRAYGFPKGSREVLQLTLDDRIYSKNPNAREIQRKLAQVALASQLDSTDSTLLEAFSRRNQLTNVLGSTSMQTPRMESIEMELGDRLVLTTDGVHDNLTDVKISRILRGARTAAAASEDLVATARMGNKPDDITAIVIEIPSTTEAPIPPTVALGGAEIIKLDTKKERMIQGIPVEVYQSRLEKKLTERFIQEIQVELEKPERAYLRDALDVQKAAASLAKTNAQRIIKEKLGD